jgi:hypothetical protein
LNRGRSAILKLHVQAGAAGPKHAPKKLGGRPKRLRARKISIL